MKFQPGQTDVNCRPSVNPELEEWRRKIAEDTEAFIAAGGKVEVLCAEDRLWPSRKLTNDERLEMMWRNKKPIQ